MVDAVQTIQAFIKETSANPVNGLSPFAAPEPDVALKAMAQLVPLAEDDRAATTAVDLSHVDLKGLSLSSKSPFVPRMNFYAPTSDFRMAILPNADFSHVTLTLTNSFLTCANLHGVKFGKANIAGADFSGADLTGADLSQVAGGLTTAQLSHALVDSTTKYPEPSNTQATVDPPTSPWQSEPGLCSRIATEMTGMLPGEGYGTGPTCPAAQQPGAIAEVCAARTGP